MAIEPPDLEPPDLGSLDGEPPADSRSTARKVLVSAGAASISQVWRVGVTFATHLLLRRLIPPEEMGVWSWAEPLFLLLAQIRDLGVPGHVVRDRERPFGNFLLLETLWGGSLAGLVLLGAPILAMAYHDTDDAAPAVIRALCLFLVVQGLGTVPMVYFESEIQVQKAVPAELLRNGVFAILSIGFAWQGWGVWAIIWAHITAGVVYAAMLWRAAWGLMPLRFVPRRIARLVWMSLPLMVMSLLEQAVLKLDTFVLGLRFDSAVVGTAGLAVYAVFFFPRLLADSIGRALYPAFVRYGPRPAEAFAAFRHATLFLTSFATPMAFFLFVNAEAVVLFLGGRDWLGAANYLRVLSLVPLVRPLAMFGLELLLTRHMDKLLVGYTLLNLVSLGGLGLWLTSGPLGAEGMAVAGYFPIGLVVLVWGLYRLSPAGLRSLVGDLLRLDFFCAACFVPIVFLLPASAVVARVGLSIVAGLLCLGYAWRRHGRSWRAFANGQF